MRAKSSLIKKILKRDSAQQKMEFGNRNLDEICFFKKRKRKKSEMKKIVKDKKKNGYREKRKKLQMVLTLPN